MPRLLPYFFSSRAAVVFVLFNPCLSLFLFFFCQDNSAWMRHELSLRFCYSVSQDQPWETGKRTSCRLDRVLGHANETRDYCGCTTGRFGRGEEGETQRWDDRLERRENRDTPLACLLLFEQQTDKIRLFCFLVDIVTNRTFVCKSFPEHLISLVLALVLYPNKTYLFLDDICSICLLNKVSLQLVFFAMGSTVVYR